MLLKIFQVNYKLKWGHLLFEQQVINVNNAISIKMSVNKTASKHVKTESYGNTKSPRNYGSQQTVVDRDNEARLIEKVQKLKSALRSLQKHNEQLHRKLKMYRIESEQKIPYLEQQIKVQRKKMQMKQKEHEEQINRMNRINLKKQQQIRALSTGKISHLGESENKIRDFDIEAKSKDMKIVQLEGIIKDLRQEIQHKDNNIKQLHQQIQTYRSGKADESGKRVNLLHDQLQMKITESHQHNKQIFRLKQSLKDSLKKNQKSNSQLYQQTEKNKHLQQQLKESRRVVDMLQKETSLLRDSSQKIKSECLEYINKNRGLEKKLLEIEYSLKSKQQKYETLQQSHEKQQQQFKSLLEQYRYICEKNEQLLTNQYELHRDFERELHTIVKQITRRHIVSKSLISSINNAGKTECKGENRNQSKGDGRG